MFRLQFDFNFERTKESKKRGKKEMKRRTKIEIGIIAIGVIAAAIFGLYIISVMEFVA